MTFPQHLGKRVTARTATGDIVATGKMIAYSGEPMVGIEDDDGKQIWWVARLCEADTK